jgi:hypothetical protein
MTTKLWDFYDGEPFMQNPRLGILALGNKPRKRGHKKGRKAMARRKRRQPAALRKYWASHRKGRKRSPRRRRARRNWAQSGALVPVNPRRRHHRRRHRMNAHHRRRRHHYRRNPSFLGLSIPPIRTVAFGALGFASPPLVQGFLTSMAPSVMQTAMSAGMIGKYAVKAGSVALASWLTHKFIGASDGNAVMIGGSINVGLSLINDFAPGFLPANPLSAYVPVRPGMRAYIPTRAGLRGIRPMQRGAAIAGGMPKLMAPGTAANLGSNSMWGPALRYQRY